MKHLISQNFISVALIISVALHLIAAVAVISSIDSHDGNRYVVADIQLNDIVPNISSKPAARFTMPADIKTPHTEPPHQEPAEQKQPSETPEEVSPPSTVASTMATTALGLGMSHGYVSSLSHGATLRTDIRTYYFEIVEKINQAWWKKAATLTSSIPHDGVVEIMVGKDGSLINAVIQQGTGAREIDKAMLETIKEASPLPALPASFELSHFRAPLKITAPSHFFRIQ